MKKILSSPVTDRLLECEFRDTPDGVMTTLTDVRTGKSARFDAEGNLLTGSLDVDSYGQSVRSDLDISLGDLCALLFRGWLDCARRLGEESRL